MYEQVLCRSTAEMHAFVAVCWCATHDWEQDCSCSSNAAIQLDCPKYLSEQAAPGECKAGLSLIKQRCSCSAHSVDIAV